MNNIYIQSLTAKLEDEITDPEEETFLLFAQPPPSMNLGFIDPHAHTIDLSINGRDYTIHQSPSVLSSNRSGGTTGAVLWKITPLFASFISSPSSSPLLQSSIISPSSSILELGCGISTLTALSLRSHISSYTLTDQPYVSRLIAQNIAENSPSLQTTKIRRTAAATATGTINFRTLDWEEDQITPDWGTFDAVLCCDCVYNETLIPPLVQTCADACRLRSSAEDETPTVCIVAQQLRSPDVFETWMKEFHRFFRAWRFPDDILPGGLRSEDGFVIHAGILRT